MLLSPEELLDLLLFFRQSADRLPPGISALHKKLESSYSQNFATSSSTYNTPSDPSSWTTDQDTDVTHSASSLDFSRNTDLDCPNLALPSASTSATALSMYSPTLFVTPQAGTPDLSTTQFNLFSRTADPDANLTRSVGPLHNSIAQNVDLVRSAGSNSNLISLQNANFTPLLTSLLKADPDLTHMPHTPTSHVTKLTLNADLSYGGLTSMPTSHLTDLVHSHPLASHLSQSIRPATDNTYTARNCLDRIETRCSNRTESRKDQDPYCRNAVNAERECHRGGTKHRKKKKGKKQVKGWAVLDKPICTLGDRASETISKLSQGTTSNLANESTQTWIRSMRALVAGGLWKGENGAFVTDSLQSLVLRCKRSLEMVTGLEFITMINMLQLAAKTDCIMRTKGHKSVGNVFDLYVSEMDGGPSLSTFRTWVGNGTKFASIAGAGSIYCLMVIAAKNLRAEIAQLKFDEIYALSNVLRWPDPETDAGKDVCECLIPLIDHLRRQLPLRLSTMFPPSLLEDMGSKGDIDCSDLDSSDRFFDSIKKNSFMFLTRNREIWARCLEPLVGWTIEPAPLHIMNQNLLMSYASTRRSNVSSRPPSPLSDSDSDVPICDLPQPSLDNANKAPLQMDKFQFPDPTTPNFMVLNTWFDIRARQNKKVPYPRDAEARKLYMDQERLYACSAQVPRDSDDFACKISQLYDEDGVKGAHRYVLMDKNVFDGNEVQLNCSDSSLGAFVWGDMPKDMRLSLERNVSNALLVESGPSLVYTDSSIASEGFKFPAIHLDMYMRNGPRGDGAPQDMHPYLLRRKERSKTNHYQLIPRVSKELMEHTREYTNLCNSFEEFFLWVEEKLIERLPEIYEDLSMFVDVLPGKEASPVHPFSGFVLNLNVVTRCHRDVKD